MPQSLLLVRAAEGHAAGVRQRQPDSLNTQSVCKPGLVPGFLFLKGVWWLGDGVFSGLRPGDYGHGIAIGEETVGAGNRLPVGVQDFLSASQGRNQEE